MLYGRLKGPPKNLLVPHFKELRTEAFSPSYVPQRGRLADAAEAEYRHQWERQHSVLRVSPSGKSWTVHPPSGIATPSSCRVGNLFVIGTIPARKIARHLPAT